MKRVCAWCNSQMAILQSDGSDADNSVTHSICDDCADNLDFQMGVALSRYLNSLKMPIIARDEQGQTIAVNDAARTITGEKHISLTAWDNRIFECAHARLPEGCMKTVHCSGCAIRFITAEVYRTGVSQLDVPAYFSCGSTGLSEKFDLLVSADKVNSIVVLRLVRS